VWGKKLASKLVEGCGLIYPSNLLLHLTILMGTSTFDHSLPEKLENCHLTLPFMVWLEILHVDLCENFSISFWNFNSKSLK
jgi:hypothetical protein